MSTKTVLRALLSKFGIMSVEMQTGYPADIGSLADEQVREMSVESEIETA